MKINYQSINGASDKELREHFDWLASFGPDDNDGPGRISKQQGPVGYENFHVVDVLGTEFVWMNETFPKESFTWYLWFESVFLVPDEMIVFLILRWS